MRATSTQSVCWTYEPFFFFFSELPEGGTLVPRRVGFVSNEVCCVIVYCILICAFYWLKCGMLIEKLCCLKLIQR